jgi:lysophospholipase L1-like esterase
VPVAAPLTDLGANEYIRLDGQATGFMGGLYPDGRNQRPPDHETAGQAIAATIVPLNELGEPDANGRIVLISVGMSNTNSEFNQFMEAIHQNPAVHPAVKAVNGAQSGRVANDWAAPDTDTWDNLNTILARANSSPAQVQIAWIKLTLTDGGSFPEKAEALQANLFTIVQQLKARYPNLKLAYLSSRTRSYVIGRGLSPEPAAYETGFAVRWLIEQQINGDPALNFDPTKGTVMAPYLSWGPYLWIDGENERADGRLWLAEDLAIDCTHPSRSGNQKVAQMLLEFFLTDSTTGWFRAGEAPVVTVTHTAPPTATSTVAPTVTTTATPSGTPTHTAMPAPTATAVPAPPTPQPLPPSTTAPEPDRPGMGTAVWPLALLFTLIIGGSLYWLTRRRP